MATLITSSLVDSIAFYQTCPKDWKERAETSLVNTLKRDYKVGTPEDEARMARGRQFEDAVRHAAVTKNPNGGSEHFKWFVAQCIDGQWGRKGKRIVQVDGQEYCLYGKYDVWFPTVIKDLKATHEYKGKEKYLKSFQGPLYLWLSGAKSFYWLIAEFNDESTAVQEHYIIELQSKGTAYLSDLVKDKIKQLVAFFDERPEWRELWLHTFTQY